MTEPWPTELARYSRQMLFDRIGVDGQRRLAAGRVLLVGCGALGTVIANTLVRAGVGRLRICDRDYIEPNNLQRQVLFDEDDIARNLPKAVAAAEKLAAINRGVEIEAEVTDVHLDNLARLAAGHDLILDGTDNFETRYLINDFAIKTGVPWVYGAVISATGLVMPVIPGETACLRCVFESAPPPEMSPTCDTAGVIGPAVNIVASLQCVEAMKLLMGRREEVSRSLTSVDVWSGRVIQLNVPPARGDAPCPCCALGKYEYLDGSRASSAITLCGRDAVQIAPPNGAAKVDFDAIHGKLTSAGAEGVRANRYMLKAAVAGHELTLFADGRAIIKGTKQPAEARTLYARFIGQ
jgi:molybdopterin/thiamine biosynthesis adenylyltransferase